MDAVKNKPVNSGEINSISKNYNGIDLFKFISSILVFILHSRIFPLQAVNLNFGITQGICRLAVPFFFVASGFFLFRKMDLYELKTDVIKNYCFRLLQLFGLWNVLILFGETGHFWYLSATMVAVVSLSICLKTFKMKVFSITLLAVLLYIVGLFGDSYSFVIAPLRSVSLINYTIAVYESLFQTTRNGFFFGFLFVVIGALFAHYDVKITAKKAFVGFLLSLGLLYLEVFLIKNYVSSVLYNMYVSLIPATFFLFAFAMNVNLKDRPIYRRLRTVSMLVYFMHWAIKDMVGLLLDNIKSRLGIDLIQYMFIISLVLILLVTFFLEWLSHKEKFKWIKWLV